MIPRVLLVMVMGAVPACGYDGVAQLSGDDAGGLPIPSTSTDEEVDAGLDGGVPVGPAASGPSIIYVVSSRFWTLDPTTRLWGGKDRLPGGSCPGLEELALDSDGHLFGVGSGNKQLFAVAAKSPPSCTPVGSAGVYPVALAFAPKGTIDPTVEVLVGYRANGQYVRINTTTGAVSALGPSPLGGDTAGDLVNVGAKGYVASSSGALFEIDWKTGALGPSLGKFPTSRRITGLAHWAGKLYVLTEQDEMFTSFPADPRGATRLAGPAGYSNVVYHGAASSPSAPAQ